MKKSVIAGFACLMSAATFAGMDNILVTFSTPGPDAYADGTLVLDGECYALVWTRSGSTFAGINADGTAVGDDSKVVIAAPVAKNHRCPSITYQIDSDYAAEKGYTNGTWGVYLLDTRRYKADANGVILTDANGNKIVDSVGGSTVNGYGEVKTLSSTKMASDAAGSAVSVSTTSAAPTSAANLKINDIKFIGDNVYLYVTGSLSCMSYELKAGDAPNSLAAPADGKAQYGADEGEMIIVTPKKPGAQFFRVNRK